MKFLVILARIVLGGLMVFSGLNKFFHFVELGDYEGKAAEFMGILASTHYLEVVAVLEVLGGLFLLIGYFVPLGLTLLGPVIVNIVLFHVLLAKDLAPPAIGSTLLFVFVFVNYWPSFASVLRPTPERVRD